MRHRVHQVPRPETEPSASHTWLDVRRVGVMGWKTVGLYKGKLTAQSGEREDDRRDGTGGLGDWRGEEVAQRAERMGANESSSSSPSTNTA